MGQRSRPISMSSWPRAFPFSNSKSSWARLPPTPAWTDVPDVAEDVTLVGTKEEAEGASEDRWSNMLPELLSDIVRRVESDDGRWPLRRSVVSCASVCRLWREVTTGMVAPLGGTGKITFPSSLKEKSNAYVGKVRSDYLGTKSTIYDSRPPFNGAKASSSRASRRFACKQISPQVPAGNFEVGQVFYKLSLLKTRGPRRMMCTLQCATSDNAQKEPQRMSKMDSCATGRSVILRNKEPRWHEHLHCWCLNFHGRVTVASAKNFQLVATSDSGQTGNLDTVLLQFGKVGDDVFTMDYREPLSAFQAFAICLTSFGTKFACE